MRLDQRSGDHVVEAHGRAIRASADVMAAVLERKRVERASNLCVLVGADLGLAPGRDVVRRARRRKQLRLLVGLEVLAWLPLRGGVRTASVLVSAPRTCATTCIVEVQQALAGEAIV